MTFAWLRYVPVGGRERRETDLGFLGYEVLALVTLIPPTTDNTRLHFLGIETPEVVEMKFVTLTDDFLYLFEHCYNQPFDFFGSILTTESLLKSSNEFMFSDKAPLDVPFPLHAGTLRKILSTYCSCDIGPDTAHDPGSCFFETTPKETSHQHHW